ncbi:MAG TPA: FAD-binding oxidoreductase, partial [Arenimonas sp.]|nr:FAD-binding oxidoreductase [Arenimonas sp.]
MATPYTRSYYSASIEHHNGYPELEGDVHADVAIIGGGFTGIATALELAEKGKKVALIESAKIGWGQSGRNGGQVTGSLSGEGAMKKQLSSFLSEKEVESFIWFLRWRGHDIIKNRVSKYNIACDLKYGHLHTAFKLSHMDELRAELALAEKYGMAEQVELVEAKDIGFFIDTNIYHGGLYNKKNMHLHPLKLCLGEAQALQSLGGLIFENSIVTHIQHGNKPEVHTAKGRVIANQVFLAGDVYHKLEQNKLSGRIFPAAGGIVTTVPLGELATTLNPKDVAVYDCRFV